MGPPTKIEELGETEVPQEVFVDYLFDLQSQFSYVIRGASSSLVNVLPFCVDLTSTTCWKTTVTHSQTKWLSS